MSRKIINKLSSDDCTNNVHIDHTKQKPATRGYCLTADGVGDVCGQNAAYEDARHARWLRIACFVLLLALPKRRGHIIPQYFCNTETLLYRNTIVPQ